MFLILASLSCRVSSFCRLDPSGLGPSFIRVCVLSVRVCVCVCVCACVAKKKYIQDLVVCVTLCICGSVYTRVWI